MKCAVTTARQLFDEHDQKIVQFEDAYADYLMQFGYQLFVLPVASDIRAISMLRPKLILLPGGGDAPSDYYDSTVEVVAQNERDILEKHLIKYAINNNIPLFGICRGMQMINGFLGGKLTRSFLGTHPIAVNHTVSYLKNNDMYEVNSFHRDFIQTCSLSKSLEAIVLDTTNKHVEAFVGVKNNILGVQWHPERVSDKEKACKKISCMLISNLIHRGEVL